SAGPRGGCGRRTGRRSAGPGPDGPGPLPEARRSSCGRPAARHKSKSGRSAPGSARLSPQRNDEASDGRRIDPDGNAEDQAGREDDFDRGVRDNTNGGEGWRGGGRRVRPRGLHPVSKFPPPGVECGLVNTTGGAERSDGLAEGLPGGQGVPPELLPAGVVAAGLGHVWDLLLGEKVSSVTGNARRPWTGRLRAIKQCNLLTFS